MSLTIADQIHELLAPIQPEDCRKANLERLAHALQVVGPVIHKAQVVSATTKDGEHTVEFDAERAHKGFPAGEIPPDEELAHLWGLPLASATPLPPADAPIPAQPKPPDPAPHTTS